MNTLNIGKKLKHLRKQNNLSQQDLADKLHRKRTSISAYEHDNIIPTLEILKQICEIYNISMDFLMDLSSPTLLKIPKKFITAEGAFNYLISHELLHNEIDKLNENEIIQFANDIQEYIEFLSLKYKK